MDFKIAIIGCGDIAGKYDERSTDKGVYSHAGAYKAFGIPIAAAIDTDKNRLKEFGRYWDVKKTYTDLSSLLSGNSYDIISICTPDETHFPIIKEILSAGPPKILWVEKPLARNYRQAMEIVETAKEKGVGIRVSYHRRWEPGHKKIKEFIKQGHIGEVTTATGYYVKGLIHIGTSIIDTLRYLVGEVRKSWLLSPQQRGSFPDDPSEILFMHFKNGCRASVSGIDGNSYTYSLFELDIIGTHGRIRIMDNGDLCEIFNLKPYSHYSGFNELNLKESFTTEMCYAMKYGLATMLESLKTHTWQDISEGINAMRNLEIINKAHS